MAIGVNTSASGSDVGSLTATTTITKPTGTASTDVLIAIFGTDCGSGNTANTITPPSGWTSIFTQTTVTSGSSRITLAGFWALGSVSGLGFSNSGTGGNYQQAWSCVGFTGVDNTNPIDATGTISDSTGSASLTVNSVTAVNANVWELIAAISENAGTNEFTATGYTFKENTVTAASAALGYNTTPKPAGATGTVSLSDSESASGQILIAAPFTLKPAAGGGGGTGQQLMMMGCGSRHRDDVSLSHRARRRRSVFLPLSIAA